MGGSGDAQRSFWVQWEVVRALLLSLWVSYVTDNMKGGWQVLFPLNPLRRRCPVFWNKLHTLLSLKTSGGKRRGRIGPQAQYRSSWHTSRLPSPRRQGLMIGSFFSSNLPQTWWGWSLGTVNPRKPSLGSELEHRGVFEAEGCTATGSEDKWSGALPSVCFIFL